MGSCSCQLTNFHRTYTYSTDSGGPVFRVKDNQQIGDHIAVELVGVASFVFDECNDGMLYLNSLL